MGKYAYQNAKNVLDKVEELLENIDKQPHRRYRIRSVCDELSIFDWWPEYLSAARLKDMRRFLKEAIKLGYTGHVDFKVGMKGCANGMWASRYESADGHTPDGEKLYKSFTSDCDYWAVCTADEQWVPGGYEYYATLNTMRKLERFIDANDLWIQ